jgi:hypothetical protein
MLESNWPRAPFRSQPQTPPGKTGAMQPIPDHGEESYVGSAKLEGKVALITGGDRLCARRRGYRSLLPQRGR